jgi:RimJ/RimL family protein N-acetyltransferase/ABC-type transporter Mla MlaB component
MSGASEIEIVVHEGLTSLALPAFCRAIREAIALAPTRLWLNFEGVKALDVAGLAVLSQAVRRAEAQGVNISILPSPTVYRALLSARLLDELPLEEIGAGPAVGSRHVPLDGAPSASQLIASSGRLGLRPPTWEELETFGAWANDSLLDQMVGSHLLYLCRQVGPYHPDFVARVLNDPAALTLVVVPSGSDARPVGFVRLFDVHLAERLAFLETAIVNARSLRAGWGIEASRLALSWAMDALEIRRVEAKVFAYNVISINALRRNGFRQEGILREAKTYGGQRWDILVFSILEAEMREQRRRDGFGAFALWETDARP